MIIATPFVARDTLLRGAVLRTLESYRGESIQWESNQYFPKLMQRSSAFRK